MRRAPARFVHAAAALFVGALLSSTPSSAVPAPGLTWRTLRTACCDVHFHVEVEAQARRVAAFADPVTAAITELVGSGPVERVQILVADASDSHNGFTLTVPYDHIELRAIQPASDESLAANEDYLRLLFTHEMTHVAHLDAYSGLPALVNVVLGKSWPPNIIQPNFVVEGLATWAESRLAKGRLASTKFHTPLRIAALNDDLWSLDDLSNPSRRRPSGGAPYLYGAAFLQWLVDRYGEDMLRRQIKIYGAGAIPYAVQRSFREAAGVDLDVAYGQFLADVRADAYALRDRIVARGGPTRARRLTRVGGTVRSPRFDRRGTLWLTLDPDDGAPGVYALHGLPAALPILRPVVRVNEAADVLPLDDGAVLVAQTESWRQAYQFHDLFEIAVDRSQRRVTGGARVRDPDRLPFGRVVVERRTASESAISTIDLATGAREDLIRYTDGTQTYTPRASPDGTRVVYSRQAFGGDAASGGGYARDLFEIDVATKTQRALTRDVAEDIDPVYTTDGRAVLFASDRDGPFAIVRLDLSTGAVTRVVDTLGGAAEPEPTPDGRGVVYVDVGLDGDDLWVAALDDFAPAASVSQRAPPPRNPDVAPSTAVAEPYSPLPTLVPRNWIPIVAADARGGPSVGVALRAEDAIASFDYSAQGTWGFGLNRPRLSATVRWKDLWTPLTFNGEWRTDSGDGLRRRDGLPEVQVDTVLRGGVSLSLPIRKRRQGHTFGLGYQRELHFVETPFTARPDELPPVYPPSSNIGAATLDWSYASVERWLDSVSTERGLSLGAHLRAANALTLSEQELYELTADVRVHHPVPGLTNHAVAVLLSGGAAFGDRLRRTSFFLGGFADRDFTQDILVGYRSGAGFLRGYPTNYLVGDAFLLATAEYRAPLWEIERGLDTLPLSIDRVWIASFVDLGSAFDGLPRPADFKAGVGVELRVDVVLGYYGWFEARAGVAQGVNPGGVLQPYLVMGIPF